VGRDDPNFTVVGSSVNPYPAPPARFTARPFRGQLGYLPIRIRLAVVPLLNSPKTLQET